MNDDWTRRCCWRAIVCAILLPALALWAGNAAAQAKSPGEVYDNTATARARGVELTKAYADAVAVAVRKDLELAVAAATAGEKLARSQLDAAQTARQSLAKDNQALKAETSALNDKMRALTEALRTERASRLRAEQSAQDGNNAIEKLRTEVSQLRDENGLLGRRLDTETSHRTELDKALTDTRGALSLARRQIKSATDVVAERGRQLTARSDELTASGVRIASLEENLRSLEERLRNLGRDRWIWAAAAALFGAVGTWSALRWLRRPPPPKVTQSPGVSVTLADWALAMRGPASATTAPFRVHTQLFPSGSQVRTFGALVRQSSGPEVHKEAA